MRPGMRHPPPGPPVRPPQRLMPAPMDGGVFFGGRDFNRRQAPPPPPQLSQQPNYPPQKPLISPSPQQWQNNVNHRPGPMPLLRQPGPWYPHGNNYHPSSNPAPPLLHPHQHPHQQFNPNTQAPINYGPSHHPTYDLSRLTNSDQIPFLEPSEDEDNSISRSHVTNNNSNIDESHTSSSPSKPTKHRRPKQQPENNRNVISYQDLDRPDEHRDPLLDNRLMPKPGKTNNLPSDKTNNHYIMKPSTDNDQALKLELDRIKKTGAQERDKIRAQRQAAAEKEAQMKRNSAKTGEKEKREDGELGDSSDDENHKSSLSMNSKNSKKFTDDLTAQTNKTTGSSHRSKTPPIENNVDSNIIELVRPFKLFHLDDDKNSAYREYLTANFGRVRVYCYKPQPNFFSNLSCLEETKRRLRSAVNTTSTILLRHLVDDHDYDALNMVSTNTEPEDGEIESDDENTPMETNGKPTRGKSFHHLSDDDHERDRRKRSKINDDGTIDRLKSSLNEKPWITNELRQLIKQRNKLQAQILNGDKSADMEKKFKKIRNKITKLAKTLKAKYENSVSDSNEPSLAPPLSTQNKTSSAITAANAANHPLSSILDPSLVMAMLMNPSLYSQVQQQVLSNPTFMQAYQHMFAEGASGVSSNKSTSSQPPKVASETQVVPTTNSSTPTALYESIKQGLTSKTSKEQQQISPTARSRHVLTQATKPIQLTSLESDTDNEQRNRSMNANTKSSSAENQAQDIALTQELIRRQIALTQQQRNQRNPQNATQLSLPTAVGRHMPLTSEQMQEILVRAKNYVTRQQTDESNDSSNNQTRVSYNTRRLQAALAASASSATPPTAHAIGQAAAAAIAAVVARPTASTASTSSLVSSTSVTTAPVSTLTTSTTTATATATVPIQHPVTTVGSSTQIPNKMPQTTLNRPPSLSNVVNVSSNPPMSSTPQQHPIRIQLDQKSKTLTSISGNQSLPIPTISQQKIMPLIDVNPSPQSHIYPAPPNWHRPPHIPTQHYPIQPPSQQQPQHYPPYENSHPPPYYGPRMNYQQDMRPPLSYGHLPPRHISPPVRFNGPLPHPGPYGYGHPPPPQNYGPTGPPPHPHYGHPYPPS